MSGAVSEVLFLFSRIMTILSNERTTLHVLLVNFEIIVRVQFRSTANELAVLGGVITEF